MPANLTPAYHEAEERFRKAASHEEKIAALEEMLAVIPKHKGTEKLQADLKTKLSKLRRQPAGKGGARTVSHIIPREGAGQIALVGPPNSGKSALVASLTHATPEVAPYPFTTRVATPGMMPYEDIAFQLLDLPPLSEEFVEHWVYDLIRHADFAWLVLDHENSLEGAELVAGLLSAKRIVLYPVGTDAPEPSGPGWTLKPALLVVTGHDRPECDANVQAFGELVAEPWKAVRVSTTDGFGLDEISRATFTALEVIRVYTKQPGKPPDRKEPFALRRGATVADLARSIHKDLIEQMKFARIWGESAFDGQQVQGDHVLLDGDVVELHL